MTQRLQLTEQRNPLAQTFRVVEPGGSVITGIGLYFASVPAVTDEQLPVTLELRPVQDGVPSSTEFFPGTRVSTLPNVIRSKASTDYSAVVEHKFTFPEPLFVQQGSEIAFVLYTSAPVGQWTIWAGSIAEFEAGSTTKRITKQLDTGSMYESSNGTTWSPSQYTDLAFKVYRANFVYDNNWAHIEAVAPALKKLTETNVFDEIVKFPRNPLSFTASSDKVRVTHPNHGFNVNDRVYLTGLDSSDTINGVKGSSIVGTRLIDSADPFGYTITMDSAATATLNGGGSNMLASEQAVMDMFGLVLPRLEPQGTSVEALGSFTTHKSFAGSQTPYQVVNNIKVPLTNFEAPKEPYVVASLANENDATKLNGTPSTAIKVLLTTNNSYVAPSFNLASTTLRTLSALIDYSQSNDSDAANRNYITTIPYTSETEPSGGTSASKHITIPFTLANSANSIRVYVEAFRPQGAEFDVWFRTAVTAEEELISTKSWTQFSKTVNPPNRSNYSENGYHLDYREYEFNVYDISEFDQYQIKITMHTTNSSSFPLFRNLRTIATV